MAALHKMLLTDGELAVVKGYRDDHAAQWSAGDKALKRSVTMAILRRGGLTVVEIARRYKRTTAADVANAVREATDALEVYAAKRPPSTWPADMMALAALVARPRPKPRPKKKAPAAKTKTARARRRG